MPQYTRSSEYASIVAVDQHARSLVVRAASLETGVVESGRLDGPCGAAELVAWAGARGLPRPWLFAYESGPCGFQLARDLRAAGHACEVVAVSSIARSSQDRACKDDRADAARLLSELTCADCRLSFVWVPEPEVEAAREAVRLACDAADALKRCRQRVSSMLLRHGVVWDERTERGTLRKTWGRAWDDWLGRVELADPTSRRCLGLLVAEERRLRGTLEDAASLCEEIASSPRFAPFVDALCRVKGVDRLTALAFASSIGDPSRFGGGRDVARYLGLTPGRRDSGARSGRNGGITKAGDATVRRLLVEGHSSLGVYARGPKAGDPSPSAAVEAEAEKMCRRQAERYRHLVGAGKCANVAKVAVVRETAAGMWAICTIVQRELREARAVA